jgi:hypothetical protein
MAQKLDQQSRQQALRAYCPNIYTEPTGWNEKTLRDDISVVFVKTQFHFDEKVRPIKLGTGLPIQGVVLLIQKVNYKVNVHNPYS